MDPPDRDTPDTVPSVPVSRRPRVLAAAFIVALFAVFMLDTSKESGLGPFATVAVSILGILIVWVLTFVVAAIPVYAAVRFVEKVQAARSFFCRFGRKRSTLAGADAEILFELRLALWTQRALKAAAVVTLLWAITIYFAKRYGYFDVVFRPFAVLVGIAYGLLVLMTFAFLAGRALDLVVFAGGLVAAPFKRRGQERARRDI